MDINCPQQPIASPIDDPAGDWMSNSRSTLLVVITLIATLSFQLGVNPPGGFWQDDVSGPKGHTAGNAIMKDKNPKRYLAFSVFCWLCFSESMVLVLWLLNGAKVKSRGFKGLFVFCFANLVFLFLASQTGAHLPWAFVTWALVMVWGAWVVYIN